MPVTPFHFGVGLLGKGLAPKTLSLSAFVVSQIVIDLESAYFLFVAREWPVHRAMHTFALGSLVGLAAGVATWAVTSRVRPGRGRSFLSSDRGFRQCLVGGFLGGATHPFLDGVMHSDIQPLLPFGRHNPFLGLLGLAELHLLCVLAGAIGLALLALRAIVDPEGARKGRGIGPPA